MHDSQCGVTVFDGIYDNTDGKQIIDLIDCLILIDHLLINGKEMLGAAGDLRLNARLIDLLANLTHKALHVIIPDTFAHDNLLYQVVICLRIQVPQGQILQFNLNLTDTKTLSDRTVDFLCLSCNALLCFHRLILQGTHIVQAVCQLDHDYTDILRHGKEHLAQVLRLHLQTLRILLLRILRSIRQV